MSISKRRQLLLDSALALFTEKGYANTTIQMILDRSGVSKGTFYKFFNSKDECMLAILEQRMQEDLQLRKSLENLNYASEFELLVDQIAIPMTLPEKQRVLELFWAGYYSGEFDTAGLIRMQLGWLAERLIELYGEEIEPYAYEGAILCYGILHQIANTSRNFYLEQPAWKEIVARVLGYIEVLMKTMRDKQEHIFDTRALSVISAGEHRPLPDKKALIDDLHALNQAVQKSKEPAAAKELVKGLLSIWSEDEVNVSVAEAVLQAFQKHLYATSFRSEANRIAKDCWWYIEHLKQK